MYFSAEPKATTTRHRCQVFGPVRFCMGNWQSDAARAERRELPFGMLAAVRLRPYVPAAM